jgi:hypothetical protein
MVVNGEIDRAVSARSEVYDPAEHRAREMAEADGFDWARMDAGRRNVYTARADLELAVASEHVPPGWAILALCVVLAFGGVAMWARAMGVWA